MDLKQFNCTVAFGATPILAHDAIRIMIKDANEAPHVVRLADIEPAARATVAVGAYALKLPLHAPWAWTVMTALKFESEFKAVIGPALTSIVAIALLLLPGSARAATVPAVDVSIDMSGLANAAISFFFAVVGPLMLLWLRSHMKDRQSADVLDSAIQNALGAAEEAARGAVTQIDPRVRAAGLSPDMQVRVQYVMDHAGDEAARFGITPSGVAAKIAARLGGLSLDASTTASANATMANMAIPAAATPLASASPPPST